jgi:hypothetical protein
MRSLKAAEDELKKEKPTTKGPWKAGADNL